MAPKPLAREGDPPWAVTSPDYASAVLTVSLVIMLWL